jgi:hypothetical protein
MELECIELYKSIEKNHPAPKVKRQAATLRFIMEAPKLKLGEDERVKLPILQDHSRYVYVPLPIAPTASMALQPLAQISLLGCSYPDFRLPTNAYFTVEMCCLHIYPTELTHLTRSWDVWLLAAPEFLE